MDINETPAPLMECKAGYAFSGDAAAADARVALDRENLYLHPAGGGARIFPYREMLAIAEGDYRFSLHLASGETLILSRLGYQYADFLRNLFRLRGEEILKEMLMQESVHKAGLEGEYRLYDAAGREVQKGPCEPRLYKTALVIIPRQDDPLRIPFSEIRSVEGESYTLTVTTEYGEKIVFSMMGTHLDPFKTALAGAMNELQHKTQLLLKEMVPLADSAALQKLALLMREGWAAARKDIEAIDPQLWPEIEKKVESGAAREEYAYLKSLARQDQICIGIKKGLMGDLTGEYTWFLVPIYSAGAGQPGNALAMESFTGKDTGGGATYFFRIAGRGDYARNTDPARMEEETDRFIKDINRCMLAVNFRREPIYLPEERLREPQYVKYLYAAARLPALRELRSRFIGRVIHASHEQWLRDVDDLLKFNVSTQDDLARWNKAERGDQQAAEPETEMDE